MTLMQSLCSYYVIPAKFEFEFIEKATYSVPNVCIHYTKCRRLPVELLSKQNKCHIFPY